MYCIDEICEILICGMKLYLHYMNSFEEISILLTLHILNRKEHYLSTK